VHQEEGLQRVALLSSFVDGLADRVMILRAIKTITMRPDCKKTATQSISDAGTTIYPRIGLIQHHVNIIAVINGAKTASV
jgi:hypothetical protein